MTIPITRPFFGEEERKAILRPLESGWVVQGPCVAEFERKFSEYTGSPFSAATSSCTTALHLAVASLDLKPGDEVIVPAFTWVSTANVVEYMGARPVFCDIDSATFNIDPDAVSGRITPRTVGIIPVHLFGLCAPMDPLMQIAQKRKLWVVEDAACAFGATLDGRHAGTFGEMGCFSFHPRKSITTGEGGMVTASRKEFDAHVRSLRDHGATRSDLDRHSKPGGFALPDYPYLGYNYRMTDLQGALGSVQMDRAEWILSERERVAAAYRDRLKGCEWLRLPDAKANERHAYQAFVCLYGGKNGTFENAKRLGASRDRLMAALEKQGIATRAGTHSAAHQRFYAEKYGVQPEDFPASYLAERLSLALPLYAGMTESEIGTVCDALIACGESS